MQDLRSLLDLLEEDYIEKVLCVPTDNVQFYQGKVRALRDLKKDLTPATK